MIHLHIKFHMPSSNCLLHCFHETESHVASHSTKTKILLKSCILFEDTLSDNFRSRYCLQTSKSDAAAMLVGYNKWQDVRINSVKFRQVIGRLFGGGGGGHTDYHKPVSPYYIRKVY
jgi:hypothetical protein